MLPAVPGKISTEQTVAYYNYQVRTMCQAGAQNPEETRGETSVCRDSVTKLLSLGANIPPH